MGIRKVIPGVNILIVLSTIYILSPRVGIS